MKSPFPMFARLFCLGLLLVVTSLSSAYAAQIEALVGFGMKATDSRYRDDSWTPVTIFLTGPGARGVGQVKLSVRTGARLTNYIRRVPLHDGNLNETVRFTVLLRANNSYYNRGPQEIQVQLLLDGRKLAEKTLTLPLAENASAFNVLALTKDGAGLPFLQRKKLGLVHRGFNPAQLGQAGYLNVPSSNNRPNNGIHPLATLRSHLTDPRALPATPQAYEMMDAVVLGDIPLDALAEEQVAALKLYVQQGGLLLISGNGDLARLQSPFFAEMLPVAVTGIGNVNTQPLGARYAGLSTLPRAGIAVKGKLKPGSRTLFGTQNGDNLPLVTTRDYGNGVVVFTSFDITASEFRGWAGAHALWRDLLRTGNSAFSPRTLLQNTSEIRGYYGGTHTNQLSDALAGKQATSTPSFLTVSLFVGLYILLLVPVSYYILKKIDKREFAWVTAPLLILGFTLASYAIAQSIKGGMLTVHRAVVFEGAANSDKFAGYTQMSLYSPARASYDISINGAENIPVLPSEIFTASYQNIVNELTVDQDKQTTLRNTAVRLWDKRSFDSPVFASLGEGIEVRTEMTGSTHYRATVTNRTPFTLRDCALVNGMTYSALGDLAPGETRQTQEAIPWVHKGSAAGLTLPGGNNPTFNGTRLTPDTASNAFNSTEGTIRRALSSVLAVGQGQADYYYGEGATGYGRAPNVLVGWFDDKAVDVQVNGKSAEGAEVNLVVAHLPVPENAPQNVRAASNPFLQKPVLELEDDTQPGGYSR